MDNILMARMKKFVLETVIGLGALKGAPAQVKSVTAVDGGNEIILKWVGTDGTEKQTKFTVLDAYGLAVKNGFEGTLEEWLESLKGKTETYTHEQTAAAATWSIQHNLGKQYPSIILLDEDGNRIFGDEDYYSANLTRVTFSAPLKGTAYVS